MSIIKRTKLINTFPVKIIIVKEIGIQLFMDSLCLSGSVRIDLNELDRWISWLTFLYWHAKSGNATSDNFFPTCLFHFMFMDRAKSAGGTVGYASVRNSTF